MHASIILLVWAFVSWVLHHIVRSILLAHHHAAEAPRLVALRLPCYQTDCRMGLSMSHVVFEQTKGKSLPVAVIRLFEELPAHTI